jgi:hypothetical protein
MDTGMFTDRGCDIRDEIILMVSTMSSVSSMDIATGLDPCLQTIPMAIPCGTITNRPVIITESVDVSSGIDPCLQASNIPMQSNVMSYRQVMIITSMDITPSVNPRLQHFCMTISRSAMTNRLVKLIAGMDVTAGINPSVQTTDMPMSRGFMTDGPLFLRDRIDIPTSRDPIRDNAGIVAIQRWKINPFPIHGLWHDAMVHGMNRRSILSLDIAIIPNRFHR